jgi:hypothetical protein
MFTMASEVARKPVGDGHLIVVGQLARAEGLVDGPDATHPEAVEFGRAQRPHARRAEHVDPLLERPQDLLVPDGWNPLEVPVDEADGERSFADCPVHVPLSGRR